MSRKVFSAIYIGGHPDFKKKENVRIYLAQDELKIAPLAIKIKYSDIKEVGITEVGFEKFLKIKCSINSSIYELYFSNVSNIDEINDELKKLREKPLVKEIKKESKNPLPIVIAIIVGLFIIIIFLNIPIIPKTEIITYVNPVTTTVTRSKVLFEGKNLYISSWGYRYSGPYYLLAGQTITIIWDSDSIVNVYIMNEVDWNKRFFSAPVSWRESETGTRGQVSYSPRYDETIYIQVMSPVWSSVKLYVWQEYLSWEENIVTYQTFTTSTKKYVSPLQLLFGGD
ncbi:MAG: hypothetical protein QXS37_06090 [Candidatus Aenigmatarchaeota archaeon]